MFLALSSRCDFNLIALDNTVHTDVGLIKYAWTVYQVYVSIYMNCTKIILFWFLAHQKTVNGENKLLQVILNKGAQ